MTDQNTNRGPPLHYLLPIYPGFQLLDMAGPLDILNLLSFAGPLPEMTLTLISETLDPVPVKLIPHPGANFKYDLDAAMPPNTKLSPGFNQLLTPNTTYDAYLKAVQEKKVKEDGGTSDAKPIDVLFIPGGIGSRTQRIHSDGSRSANIQSLIDFTRQIYSQVRTAIITVCTGSDILAQTGLLDSRRATTNMSGFTKISERTPSVNWVHGARWVKSSVSEVKQSGSEQPKEIWTSAGISAGMDVTLAFIAEKYGGIEVARGLAKRLEYDWREIGEGERDPLYSEYFGA